MQLPQVKQLLIMHERHKLDIMCLTRSELELLMSLWHREERSGRFLSPSSCWLSLYPYN